MHTVNAVGDRLDHASAAAFLQNLRDVLGGRMTEIIGAACSAPALRGLDPAKRDEIRASIFKQCLLHVL
jgi:hypothetical protein